jgi:urease accessory protein|uniref:Hydrogenase/urease accessory protein n=1 Tax=uncultured alpha proteobacterium EB080_L27A02 TaxID=710796 RepID=E0Y142_9PROT|nr:hydrogenase/urease accessory protein [uncultured alpha proteobacterium EB080_L27A02]
MVKAIGSIASALPIFTFLGTQMKKIISSLTALTLAGPAFAHHPLAGAPMETFTQGLLSGVGHPILGFDHLFFIALIGISAIYTGHRMLAPLAFITAMLLGTLASSFGLVIPATESMIVISLLLLGGIVATGQKLSNLNTLSLYAITGIFHGSAFGASIAGQEITIGSLVLIGYLFGLGIAQYLISIGTGFVAIKSWKATEASAIPTRMSGAFVAGMGVFLALEGIEGAIFSSLGLN